MQRKFIKVIQGFFYMLVVFLCLCVLEISLRGKGFHWEYEKKSMMIMDDDVVGWVNRPGVYMVQGSPVTILKNGSRLRHPDEARRATKVLLLGGSSIFGWRIPDDQTLAWVLEERLPKVAFLNYAVNGHSTFQSLLLLERLLKQKPAFDFLIYGYEELSDLRNVAKLSWLNELTRSRQKLPFATLNEENELVRHPASSYPVFSLMKSSALVAFLQERYLRRHSQRRESQAEFVTLQLILEMDKRCREKNVKFILALLDGSDSRKNDLIKFLGENNIAFLDCVNINYHARNKAALLENDFHPNSSVNLYWANCLQGYLKNNLKRPK